MADPVQRSSSNAAQLYRALENTSDALFNEPIAVKTPTPQQESAALERGRSSLSPRGAALHVVAEAGLHVAAKRAHHVIPPLPGVAFGKLMVEAYHGISGPVAPGIDKQREVRDAHAAASIKMAESAFPPEYVQQRTGELDRHGLSSQLLASTHHSLELKAMNPGKGQKPATPAQAAARATATMAQFQKAARQSATEGMEYAAAFKLGSEQQLLGRLAHDASFKARFDEDPAFREGVKSMVWLAEKHPAQYEDRRSLFEQRTAHSPAVGSQLQGVR